VAEAERPRRRACRPSEPNNTSHRIDIAWRIFQIVCHEQFVAATRGKGYSLLFREPSPARSSSYHRNLSGIGPNPPRASPDLPSVCRRSQLSPTSDSPPLTYPSPPPTCLKPMRSPCRSSTNSWPVSCNCRPPAQLQCDGHLDGPARNKQCAARACCAQCLPPAIGMLR
jgi:hypothetical protein